MKVYFNDDYTASKYAFDTTRKSAAVAKALGRANLPDVTIEDPLGAYEQTERLVRKIHNPQYVEAVKTGMPHYLAQSQGFDWDAGVYTMAIAHNAGVVAAVNEAIATNGITGTLSSGLHHAKNGHGEGFCTFNGLAAGVFAARQLGKQSILVIDFDAHGGGGTYSLCHEEMTQVDVIVSRFDTYQLDPADFKSYVRVTTGSNYIDEIRYALRSINEFDFDFVLYNAGMDPYNCGVSRHELGKREHLVAKWIAERQIPASFTLAGGYTWGQVTEDELVDLHLLTVDEFSRINTLTA